jgi:hypothetical protein
MSVFRRCFKHLSKSFDNRKKEDVELLEFRNENSKTENCDDEFGKSKPLTSAKFSLKPIDENKCSSTANIETLCQTTSL